jgi:hypothetical protein
VEEATPDGGAGVGFNRLSVVRSNYLWSFHWIHWWIHWDNDTVNSSTKPGAVPQIARCSILIRAVLAVVGSGADHKRAALLARLGKRSIEVLGWPQEMALPNFGGIGVLLNESETSHFQDTPFREIVTKRPR